MSEYLDLTPDNIEAIHIGPYCSGPKKAKRWAENLMGQLPYRSVMHISAFKVPAKAWDRELILRGDKYRTWYQPVVSPFYKVHSDLKIVHHGVKNDWIEANADQILLDNI